MPEFILDGAYTPEFLALDAFTRGYIEALFFTNEEQLGEEYAAQGVEPLGEGSRYSPGFSDLAPGTLAAIIKDCAAFQAAETRLLTLAYARNYEPIQAGRDFWFTRCGHGVGFWDRKELDTPDGIGEALSAACRPWGNRDAYLGDDGRVYLS